MGKSKSVIHNILRKIGESASYEAKRPPVSSRKTTARKEKYISKESIKDRFVTAPMISKKLMLTLALKYQFLKT